MNLAPLVSAIEPCREHAAYLRVLRCFAHGVAVITSRGQKEAEVHGMTATAVCSLSLEPPLLLVCIRKETRAHAMIAGSGAFAVNLLHRGQRAIAERFATCGEQRFLGVPYHVAITGSPVLDDCLGFFDCRLASSHGGGDHDVFVGRVTASGSAPGRQPLLYHAGGYCAPSEYAG